MMGDYHVRFCEGLGVKFPWPTRWYSTLSHYIRQTFIEIKDDRSIIRGDLEGSEI